MEVRLRSVSDKDEVVKVNWLERKPVSVLSNGNNQDQGEVLVPAMGFVTLDARFEGQGR
jgi:hypothetical protein